MHEVEAARCRDGVNAASPRGVESTDRKRIATYVRRQLVLQMYVNMRSPPYVQSLHVRRNLQVVAVRVIHDVDVWNLTVIKVLKEARGATYVEGSGGWGHVQLL